MRVLVATMVFIISAVCSTAKAERTITPMVFYELFNLRTINTAMWNNLRAYCQSYPKDFFEISEIRENYISLNQGGDYFMYVHIYKDGNVMINEAIYSGTYRDSMDYHIYYDEDHSDCRAKGGVFNEILNDCESYAK